MARAIMLLNDDGFLSAVPCRATDLLFASFGPVHHDGSPWAVSAFETTPDGRALVPLGDPQSQPMGPQLPTVSSAAGGTTAE